MSSGFVSAGTTEEPAERDDEWRRAQEELEEERRRKAEVGKQQGGKSLYEVLQQNKSECVCFQSLPGCPGSGLDVRFFLPNGASTSGNLQCDGQDFRLTCQGETLAIEQWPSRRPLRSLSG